MVEYRWSRVPGKFIDKMTGVEYVSKVTGKPHAFFCGSEREWRETLIEVIIDTGNQIFRQGSVQLTDVDLYCSPPVAMIVKNSVLYGRTSSCGLLLAIKEENAVSNVVEFIDRTTGEVLGIVRVLDLP